MMEWNRSWTGSLILLIGYLLFESFDSVFFFFFFSLCVRRKVYKIVRSILSREERKGRFAFRETWCDLFWRRNNYSTSDQFVLRDEFSFFVSFAITVCYVALYQSHCISIPLRFYVIDYGKLVFTSITIRIKNLDKKIYVIYSLSLNLEISSRKSVLLPVFLISLYFYKILSLPIITDIIIIIIFNWLHKAVVQKSSCHVKNNHSFKFNSPDIPRNFPLQSNILFH